MKRLGLLPLLLFLLLESGALGAQARAPERRYFSSDEAGFPIAPLPGPPPSGGAGALEYLLEIRGPGAGEELILYRRGEVLERRLREALGAGEVLERVYRGGSLVEESRSGAGGLLLEEARYEAAEGGGSLIERLVYSYAGLRLLSVESLDAAGASRGRLEYRYDAAGRLAELRSSGSFSEGRSAILQGEAARPLASWSAEGEAGLLRLERFDGEGRRRGEEIWQEGSLRTRISYGYGPGGELLSMLSEELLAKTSRETRFGPGGLPVLVIERREGRELSRTESTYDEAGRLIREGRRRGAELEELSFAYDAEGRLLREETRRRGELVRLLLRLSEEVSVEELYEKGRAFVRIRYEGGRKVLEEFLEEGIVVRKRAYP